MMTLQSPLPALREYSSQVDILPRQILGDVFYQQYWQRSAMLFLQSPLPARREYVRQVDFLRLLQGTYFHVGRQY